METPWAVVYMINHGHKTEPLLNKEVVLTLLYQKTLFIWKTNQHIVYASVCISSLAKV